MWQSLAPCCQILQQYTLTIRNSLDPFCFCLLFRSHKQSVMQLFNCSPDLQDQRINSCHRTYGYIFCSCSYDFSTETRLHVSGFVFIRKHFVTDSKVYATTRIRIRCVFKSFHPGKRSQEFTVRLAFSLDTCERKG